MSKTRSKIAEIVENTVLGQAVVFAKELGVFKAIAQVSSPQKPVTAAIIARQVGLKDRYVKELLCCLACGDIVEVDDTGELFWMNRDEADILAAPESHYIFGLLEMVTQFPFIFSDLKKVFHKSGPPGLSYDVYNNIHQCIGSCTEAKYKENLMSSFMPLTGMEDRLNNGKLEVLNVGCGTAYQTIELAKQYPSAHFVGIDIDPKVIEIAKRKQKENSVQNVEFLQMNACVMPSGWARSYDWVTIFDSCHDFTRPDQCLKGICRALKSDGVLTMVDANGMGNASLDKTWDKNSAIIGYGLSTFHCLPIGSNSSDAQCLGTMWGQKRAVELLNKCGFPDVQVVTLPFAEAELLYICKKTTS